jgi:SAM-dependent methyltransferase
MLAIGERATDQDRVNRLVYHAPAAVRHYRSSELDAAETMALIAYQPAFAGRRVLDLGVGTGRTTRFLTPFASTYLGLDFSPHMVDAFKERQGGIPVVLGDMRDLSRFDDASFDFVLAACNLIDAVGHADRLHVIEEVRRVVQPRGVFMFSSHNRCFRDALSGPKLQWSRNPGTQAAHVWRYARSLVNHARVRRLRQLAPEYAILNDPGHDYAALHYYVDRATARRQMTSMGFRVLSEFDLMGRALGPDDDDRDTSSVMYVTERVRA